MRIRLYQAFASNNSGSYTLIGTFRNVADAAECAEVLAAVCDEHDDWFRLEKAEQSRPSPLEKFAAEHGIKAMPPPPNEDDDWPAYGEKPSVIATSHQVLFHVPYTVTMPRLFGEFIYQKGGRVTQELNHTHHDLAAEFWYYSAKVKWGDSQREVLAAAFEEKLRELLPTLIDRAEYDQRAAIEPAFFAGEWGMKHCAAVFCDLVEGAKQVRALALAEDIELGFRVWECSENGVDPFGALRASMRPWGLFRVILWSLGPDRIASLKAVREALQCGLTEAKEATVDLPAEILVNVDKAFAGKAVDTLKNAGCDAEIVAPATK